MNRVASLLFAIVLFYPASGRAERIYNIVNYPDLQDGHTLAGTITTTDDAPDDSLLETDEILDWQWTISGPNNLSASLIPASITQASDMLISPTRIELPLSTTSYLTFWPLNPGVLVTRLTWSTYPIDTELVSKYTVGFRTRDSIIPYWESNLEAPGTSSWIVAIAVPEPASILLIALCLLARISTSRRRFVTIKNSLT